MADARKLMHGVAVFLGKNPGQCFPRRADGGRVVKIEPVERVVQRIAEFGAPLVFLGQFGHEFSGYFEVVVIIERLAVNADQFRLVQLEERGLLRGHLGKIFGYVRRCFDVKLEGFAPTRLRRHRNIAPVDVERLEDLALGIDQPFRGKTFPSLIDKAHQDDDFAPRPSLGHLPPHAEPGGIPNGAPSAPDRERFVGGFEGCLQRDRFATDMPRLHLHGCT